MLASRRKVKVPNQLFTVPGGKHGHFTPEQQVEIFKTVEQFLEQNHLK